MVRVEFRLTRISKEGPEYLMKKIIHFNINECVFIYLYIYKIKLTLDMYNCTLLFHNCMKIRFN